METVLFRNTTVLINLGNQVVYTGTNSGKFQLAVAYTVATINLNNHIPSKLQ